MFESHEPGTTMSTVEREKAARLYRLPKLSGIVTRAMPNLLIPLFRRWRQAHHNMLKVAIRAGTYSCIRVSDDGQPTEALPVAPPALPSLPFGGTLQAIFLVAAQALRTSSKLCLRKQATT